MLPPGIYPLPCAEYGGKLHPHHKVVPPVFTITEFVYARYFDGIHQTNTPETFDLKKSSESYRPTPILGIVNSGSPISHGRDAVVRLHLKPSFSTILHTISL